jgi:Tol biopolymer transport system component
MPTVSQDANRLAVMKTHIREDIYVGELQDGGTRLASPKRMTVSESLDLSSGWMRDGKTVLFESNRAGRSQVFRQQINEGTPERLIMGLDDEEGAELSPDGLWILYWSSSPGGDSPATVKQLMRFPAVGGHPEQLLEVEDPDAAFDCPVRPSSSCVISHWNRGQLNFYALDAIRGEGKELAKTELRSSKNLDWSVSPEGLRIGLLIKDQSPEQVRILDLQNGEERNLPIPHGWHVWSPSWTADGDALFAAARSTTHFIARVELDGKTRVLFSGSANQSIDSPYPSPDGRHLVFSQRTTESNAWLLENF